MKRKFFRLFHKDRGFTIVEVMIVLAIAALIMVVVFIAVSQLQQNRRDSQRKSYVGNLLEAEEQYLKNNGRFPACDGSCSSTDRNNAERFISLYMPDGTDPSTGEKYNNSTVSNYSGAGCSGNGVSTAGRSTIYCYDSSHVSHNYVPPTGQIFIGVGHYCMGDGPSESGDGPLSGSDRDLTRIVILVGLEKGYYCIDNNASV